jgi:telomere length regulation protein
MDDLLKPVKTVRNVKSNIEKFETLSLQENQAKKDVASTHKTISEIPNGGNGSLNTGRTIARKQSVMGDDNATRNLTARDKTEKEKSQEKARKSIDVQILSPDQALAILKEQITEERFKAVIQYLNEGIQKKHDFNIQVPNAAAAQILNVLVSNVIPDWWDILNPTASSQPERKLRKLLLSCMNSPAGIGALLARIQSLIATPQVRQSGSSQHAVFRDTVSLFVSLVYHKAFVRDLLAQIQSMDGSPGQQQAVWAEATSLLAGSRVLNVFQEASATLELKDDISSWLQDPKEYSVWLGVNIASAAISLAPTNDEAWKMLASFLKRAMSLGYRSSLSQSLHNLMTRANILQMCWFPRSTRNSY